MELQFLVMANMTGSVEEVARRLAEGLGAATKVRARSFDWRGNWLQVADNADYDPAEVDDPEDGFLAFRFKIEVSPIQTVDRQHQVEVARNLVRKLTEFGARAAVCADFEDEMSSV